MTDLAGPRAAGSHDAGTHGRPDAALVTRGGSATHRRAQRQPRRSSVLRAQRRILQLWVQGRASCRGMRRLVPGGPIGNTPREGSLVVQASPAACHDTLGSELSGPVLLPLTACPRRRPDSIAHLLDGETVVLDRQAGVIHQLNHTASYIWPRCDGHSTIADIAHPLADVLAVEATVAARDVGALVRQLQA